MPFEDYYDTDSDRFGSYPVHLIFTDRLGQQFENLGTPVDMPKNQMLFRAGDIPDCCYYIKRGRVMAFEFTSSGEERIYNINEQGSIIFEPCVILNRALTLNFKTMTASTLFRIPRETLLDAVLSDPSVAADLLYSLSEKFLEVNEQIRESAVHSVHWKVCNLLLTYAYKYGVDYDGKVLINEKISQQLLANLLRVNRVTVARVIRELRDSGLVEQINGYYCIRSIDNLRNHMQYIDSTFN
jgi:CRP/FNR family transcriptional regulator